MKIFADGANVQSIRDIKDNPLITGFTTNPSLMRSTGIQNYKEFGKYLCSIIPDRPISFEVISDDFKEMKRQALEIASWGSNVFVKIPVTNTKGESSNMLIQELNWSGIKINVTAITTFEQVFETFKHLQYKRGVYISIFAGRIADTGISPCATIINAVDLVEGTDVEIIWASPREVYNIYQAEKIGCHIITCTSDLIKKYEALKGKDLTEYSRETIQMFYRDAKESGLTL